MSKNLKKEQEEPSNEMAEAEKERLRA